MGLIDALGIDVRILLAQFINFAVLIFVLYRFLYTPLLDMMRKRKKIIAEGVARAEESEKIRAEAVEEAKKIVLEARREAKGIVADAHSSAKETADAVLEKAKLDAQEMAERARKAFLEEKQNTLAKLKSEIADLVVVSTQKVVSGKLDARADKAFIEEIIVKGDK